MANILPRHFFYAMIVFSMLVAGSMSLISMVKTGSGGGTAIPNLMTDAEETNLNSTIQIDNLDADIESIRGTVTDLTRTENTNIFTIGLAFIDASWSAIKLIMTSFGLLDSSIDGLRSHFQLPGWFSLLLGSLIGVLLIFSILSVIFGKDI